MRKVYKMQKKILKLQLAVSIVTSALLAGQVNDGYKISGEVRGGYVSYDYDSAVNDTDAFAVVYKVGLETPKYNGFYAKIMGAGVNDLGQSDLKNQRKSNIFQKNKLNNDRSNFNILQELYIGYDDGKNELKIGRNEFVSPMISKDDFYMFANSFETISYTNKMLKDMTVNIGYIHKMAGIWDSRSDGSNFRSMSDASMTSATNKLAANDSSVYYAGVDYKNGANRLKVWEYYAKDLYNTVFAQYDYIHDSAGTVYDFGVQMMNFKEVGKLAKSATTINTSIYAAQLDVKMDSGVLLNASITKYGSGDGENSVQGAWGGYAYYTKGFIFHFHESNSFRDAFGYKLQAGYDFAKAGVNGLSVNFRYTDFELNNAYKGAFVGQDSLRFYGVQAKYDISKSSYFIATYEKGELGNVPDFHGLRLIGGYRF